MSAEVPIPPMHERFGSSSLFPVGKRAIAVTEPSWLARFEIVDKPVEPKWRSPWIWLVMGIDFLLPGSSAIGRRRRTYLVDAVLEFGERVSLGTETDAASADVAVRRALRLAENVPTEEFRNHYREEQS